MRRLCRAVLLAVMAAGAGCTFLIDFDEVDRATPDGSATDGPMTDARDPDASGATDTGMVEGGPLAFPPPCDPDFPLADVKCNPTYPRPNCASNTTVFPDYPAGHPREGDLVTCNGSAKPTCVQHCPFGCASMPVGFPDACDDCDGRPDGTYCVKDLRGPDGRSLGLAVDCVKGRTMMAHTCGTTAASCATKCPRAGGPFPSCCN